MRSVWVVSILLGLLSGRLYAEPTPVEVVSISYQPHAKMVRSSGQVRPVSEQALAFKVGGILERIFVQEGQAVKRGAIIARLDLEEMEAGVARAESLVADAQRQTDRLGQLRQRKLVSEERVQQAETVLQVTLSDLRVARFNRQHAEIRAPADGRVLQRLLEQNELVQPGQSVLVFADETQGWAVSLGVADVDVVKLALGDRAEVRLDAYPGRVFSATVREISGRADPRSLTFAVEVALQQPPKLYSGLIAHADIMPSQVESLAQLPLSALVSAQGGEGDVYRLDHTGLARLAHVDIAYLEAGGALIRPGLEPGARIITQGSAFLFDGAPVRILD